MLCGGEPLVVPHFFALAEALGARRASASRSRPTASASTTRWRERLARLPIRSVQISLDGDTQATYARQRVGGSLAQAHAACRAVRAAGLPLEVTFAPTRINLHEAEPVIERARSLGAFRFNTGRLMRIGTAARLWDRLEPTEADYAGFRRAARSASRRLAGEMELCYEPFEIRDGLRGEPRDPPATLLVLPNGWVKVAAALPHICADLRRDRLDGRLECLPRRLAAVIKSLRQRARSSRTRRCSQTRMAGMAPAARRIEITTEDPMSEAEA